jgi:hypothetical protein
MINYKKLKNYNCQKCRFYLAQNSAEVGKNHFYGNPDRKNGINLIPSWYHWDQLDVDCPWYQLSGQDHINIMAQKVIHYHVHIISKKVIAPKSDIVISKIPQRWPQRWYTILDMIVAELCKSVVCLELCGNNIFRVPSCAGFFGPSKICFRFFRIF